MNPRTLTRRPLGLALAPAPDRPAPRPAMTWAEMARAEGHRRRFPESPGSAPVPIQTRMLRALSHGPSIRSDLFDRFHESSAALRPVLDALVAEGLAVVATVPGLRARPCEVVALTAEGQRRARE